MLGAIRNIDFDDWTEGFPAFLVIVLMPFTYASLTVFSAGLIAYPHPNYCGPCKEVNWIMYVYGGTRYHPLRILLINIYP